MKNKPFYLLIFVILAVNIIDSYGQQADTVKTVYELFNLSSEGCDFPAFNEELVTVLIEEDHILNEQKEEKENDLVSLMENYTPLFQRNDKISLKFENPSQPIVKFTNGNKSFKNDNKYGLIASNGDIIIPAQFHSIINCGETGFIAYKDQFCNYYSNEGNKLLNRDYFYIKPTIKNTLIVQTEKGFGIISIDNKILVAPQYYQIKEVSQNEQFYYWISKSKDIGFYLSENTKDTIHLNTQPGDIEFIDSSYWYNYGKLLNVKTNKIVICEENFIEIVSNKHQLAIISDSKAKLKYLMKYNGDLVVNHSFKNISKFQENNHAIASIEKDKITLYGIINQYGKWTTSPQYDRLFFLNDSMLAASNINRKSGIVTINNDTVISFEYDEIKKINEHYVLCVKLENKTIHSDIVDLYNLEIIKSDLPYTSIRSTMKCNTEVFIANANRKECLVNNNFEKISPEYYTRIFYGPNNNSFIGTNFLENNKRESQLFNCEGKLQTIKIKRKKYTTFYNYEEITPDLHHIMLSEESGYFINAKGKTIDNNNHWQNIVYSNVKDLFITMKYGGKYGIINSTGETIIPPVFEHISPFDNITGLASYNFDNKQKGYIKTDGKLLFETKYLETILLSHGIFKVKINGKWGVANLNGAELVPIKYSEIWLNGGIIYAKIGESIERFDLFGNTIN